MSSAISAGAHIGAVYAQMNLAGSITASGRVGFGKDDPYLQHSAPNNKGITTKFGKLSAAIAAQDIWRIASEQSDVDAIVLSSGIVGVVEALQGRVSILLEADESVMRVSGQTGVDGLVAASYIGDVWSGANNNATVRADWGIGSVRAANDVTGTIVAYTGSIGNILAGQIPSASQTATGGSITSPFIRADLSISSVVAYGVLLPNGEWAGGNISAAEAGIRANNGFISTILATRDITTAIKAGDTITSITAGTFIAGDIESKNGSILNVTATSQRISGNITANLNIGTITAYTNRIGNTTTTLGSIGNITATTGKIDGEISGFKGLGNITAGTSILKSITAAGAGASAGNIRAGADTAGNIAGAIFVNGNIQSVVATAVQDNQLPTGSTAVPMVVAMPGGGKPPRQNVVWPVLYTGGNIAGGVFAAGSIFDVKAHGNIAGYVTAGAQLPKITGYKRISADLTAESGGTSVTTYGELTGDITVPGFATIWAYDDVSGTISISDGGFKLTTWGSFLSSGESTSKFDVDVWAYDKVTASLIKSIEGNARVTGLDSIDSIIRGKLNAIAVTNGSLAGSVDAQTRNGFMSAFDDSTMSIETGRDAIVAIDGNLSAEIKADGATRTVVKSLTGSAIFVGYSNLNSVWNTELYLGSAYINVLNDVQRVTVKSLLGSVYLESANVMDSRVVAERGAIAVNAHGHVTGVRILADDLAALYASGTINATNVTSVNNGVSVIGINGVIGRFESFDPTEGTGNVAVTSHNGISGTIKSVAGVVRTSVYGDQNAIVTAGLRSIMNVWGNINGEITTGGITAFARKDISSTITLNAGASALAQSVSTAELVAGGKVDGSVTDATNRTQYATVRALGDVTGNVKIKGQIYVLANNVSGDIESTSRGINIHAAGNVTGNVHAVSDVNIFVGHNITVPGGAGNSGRSDDQAPVSSKQGSVRLAAMGTIMAGVSAGKTIDALEGREITSTSGHAGTGGSFIAFGVVSEATLESDSGDVFVFAGGSLSGSFTTRSGGVRALALSDLTGIFSGSEEVDVTSYGSVDSAQLSGDSVYLFGLQQADGILNGRSAASIESSYNVLGTVNAAVAVAVAGYDSTVNLDSSRSSTVVAGGSVSGIIESNGTASAISASRGSTEGGVSARVEGKVSAESITLGGSVSGLVKSTLGSAFAFAGKNVTSTIDGKTSATAIAILDVSGGEVKSIGPVRAFAYGNVGSKVSSESATAFSIAGNNITGNVRASKNAIVAAVSGTVSGTVSSTDGSSIVIGMDGISGTITSHRHSVALSSGAISSSVTANNGTAIVASLGGEVTGDVDAADYAIVVAFDEVSGNVSADKSIVVVSLVDVSGEIDAEEYAVVLAGGNVSAPVTAWNGVLVASLGNVTGSVTAENGSAIVLALGNVTNSVTATGLVAIIALGDVTVTVAQSQDAIVISGGKTEFKPVAPENSAEAFDPSQPGGTASRDFVISGLGNVRGNVQSGRDLVLVSMGSVSSNVSSQGDAVIYAFDGFFSPIPEQLPTVTAAGDAILITAGRGSAEVTAGKNAVIVSLGSAANSVVTGGELAAVITLGSGNNLSISGRTAALASTYGDFSGSVTSSEGVAVVATIGDAFDADIHGALSAVAVTVGSFDGTVTADEEDAGIISLLNANGEVHAGRSALVLSDGIVNTTVTAGEDLLIWARGDVHGSYHAGRDAAVISHGAWDAELRADRDVVFVYGRDSVRGSITAGRWIGDGSQSVPSDPTLIDDVFSRGEILAQILAGTSASSDPDKGRIGTIGAIGDVAGVISAKEIGRIRSGGAVTASLNVNGTAFDAGNAGTAGTVIQQNQSNLATLVPEPVLDPSARDEILADEAAERDAANTQRDQIAIELDASKLVVNTLRQQILNELAEDREAIRSAVDLVKILADLAVAAAQQAEAGKLTETRQYIETLYQKREAGYLKQQQDWEQVVQNAQSILEEAAREWNDLRLKAQSALEQGDQDQLRFRNLALAREQERLREHIDRWKRDLDDLRNRGSSIDGAILLDRIQLALDIFGFVPVLGAGPDAINAIISAGRGNWGDAAINLVAIIPFWGDGAKAGKMLAKAGQEGVQHVDEVGAVVNAVAKNGDSIKLLDKAIDSWCFSPDTLVAAESGKKAIREIEPGERVFAYDYGAGRFVLADVLQRHENLYSGPWVTFSANGENIALTANHPIWVVDGDGLSDRAAPEHLDIREDEGKSLVGRWINSQDLRVGDVLLSRTGGNLVIERVEVSDSVNAPVCNLTVRDYHTFLVGADELLAHNLSWCELLEKKWGREKPQELIELAEKYGYDLKYIHGHHIVMKGANDIWSAGAREILEEYGIKVIYNQTQLAAASKDELFNLAFALNNHRGIHSNAYAKAVWERLKKVVDEGLADELSKSEIADGLKDALQKMREILEKGDIFWPGY